MVQSIENWADLQGVVEEISATPAGRQEVRLALERVDAVPGFACLVHEAPGSTVRVELPGDGSPPVAAGSRVRVRVRLAGPGRYVARPGSLTLI